MFGEYLSDRGEKMLTTKPIIGILSGFNGNQDTIGKYTFSHIIEKYGGLPMFFPYLESDDTIIEFASICDGFLFTGGCDVDPKYYGEEASPLCGAPQQSRDKLEFQVFQLAYRDNKPIIGVCRGSQVINVAMGGSLYQDIPSELNTEIAHKQAEPSHLPSHSVGIKKGTPLYELIGEEQIQVNSTHHQCVKKLGKGLEVMAMSQDGVVEATYFTESTYIRAYQWHPELLYKSFDHHGLLFMDFVKACRENKECIT